MIDQDRRASGLREPAGFVDQDEVGVVFDRIFWMRGQSSATHWLMAGSLR